MSTTIDTVRTDPEPTETSEPDPERAEGRDSDPETAEGRPKAVSAVDGASEPTTPPAAWLVGDEPVDVSDVSPARVAAYARRADGAVHFERKGGRTYLVAA